MMNFIYLNLGVAFEVRDNMSVTFSQCQDHIPTVEVSMVVSEIKQKYG